MMCCILTLDAFSVVQIIRGMDRPPIAIPFDLLEASPMKFPEVDLIDGCYYKHARRVFLWAVFIDLVNLSVGQPGTSLHLHERPMPATSMNVSRNASDS